MALGAMNAAGAAFRHVTNRWIIVMNVAGEGEQKDEPKKNACSEEQAREPAVDL